MQTNVRVVSRAVAGVVGVITLGCGGLSTSPNSLPPDALGSGLYCAASTGVGPVRLENGKWSREDTAGKQTVTLADPKGQGDLDGDGDEDAAVVLVSSGGGSGTFYELAVVINDQGRPVHTSSVPLGDRVNVESLELASARIRVKMIVHDEDDAACCPTLPVDRFYRLQDGALIEATPSASR